LIYIIQDLSLGNFSEKNLRCRRCSHLRSGDRPRIRRHPRPDRHLRIPPAMVASQASVRSAGYTQTQAKEQRAKSKEQKSKIKNQRSKIKGFLTIPTA